MVALMPPASYGRAGHAGGELGGAVAGEHEVGVAVDEAGDARSARRRRCARRRPAPGRCRRRRRARRRSRSRRPASSPVVGVRDEPADAARRRSSSHSAPRASSAATSIAAWAPSRTTTRPPTTTWRTSAAVAANTAPARASSARGAGGAHRVERDRRQVGAAPRPRCGRRRASRGWRGRRSVAIRSSGGRRRGRRGCSDARRSSSSTARASSSRSITAWESLPERQAGAGVAQGDRSARCRRRGRARSSGRCSTSTPAAPSRSMSPVVRWVACTAVNRSSSAPAAASTSTGVRRGRRAHWSFSAGCSDTWACSGASRAVGPRRDDRDVVGVDGARRSGRRRRCARAGRRRMRVDALRPTLGGRRRRTAAAPGRAATPSPPRR